MSSVKALLRLWSGPVKALSRLCQDSVKALSRHCQGYVKRTVRLGAVVADDGCYALLPLLVV